MPYKFSRSSRLAHLSPHRIHNAAVELWIAGACLSMGAMLSCSGVATSTWHSWLEPLLEDRKDPAAVYSGNVQFKLTGERFPIDIIGSYNIDRAKTFIAKVPRNSRAVEVAPWRAFADHMEWKHLGSSKDSNVDYACPVIIATLDQAAGHYMLIDGWHRIQKASEEGRTTIQAFYLSEQETKDAFDLSWGGSNPAGSFV